MRICGELTTLDDVKPEKNLKHTKWLLRKAAKQAIRQGQRTDRTPASSDDCHTQVTNRQHHQYQFVHTVAELVTSVAFPGRSKMIRPRQ